VELLEVRIVVPSKWLVEQSRIKTLDCDWQPLEYGWPFSAVTRDLLLLLLLLFIYLFILFLLLLLLLLLLFVYGVGKSTLDIKVKRQKIEKMHSQLDEHGEHIVSCEQVRQSEHLITDHDAFIQQADILFLTFSSPFINRRLHNVVKFTAT